MRPKGGRGWCATRTADPEGGVFNPAAAQQQREALLHTLRAGPGEAARQEMLPTPTGPRPSRWTLRAVRATFPAVQHYTLSGVWRWLRRHQLKWRTAAVQYYSPDPEYDAKVARLLACLAEAAHTPERVVAVFLDEMGYTRWPAPGPEWGPAPPAARPCTAHAGANNRQWRLVGAVNACTGRTHYRANYIVGRRELVRFYRDLVAAYPEVEKLYVIQDNWSVHTHADVHAALAELPQVEIIWLPTYAPWLNPQEKVWRWLREAVLKLHRHAGDWPGLQAQVGAFLDQFADGSAALLRYIGLQGDGLLARALRVS